MQQTLANPTNPRTEARAFIRKPTTIHQWDAPAPLRLWHLASFDAPTVAVVWALGFAWAANIVLPLWVPYLLALAAWASYIGDRLLDARASLKSQATDRLRQRHYFHWRHRRIFIPLAICSACAAAWIVLALMPPIARERNSLLAAAAAAYFTRVHSSQLLQRFERPRLASLLGRFLSHLFSKELLVGILFTAACVLPTVSRLPAHIKPTSLLTPAIFFALLAWLNCHAIEKWESAKRESADWRSVDDRLRWPSILPVASALAFCGLLLTICLAISEPHSAVLVGAGAASALLIAVLDLLRNRLTPLALRTAADLILLTPALLFALPLLHQTLFHK